MPSAPMMATAAMPATTIPMMLPDTIPEEAADVGNVDGERTDVGDDEVNGRLPVLLFQDAYTSAGSL